MQGIRRRGLAGGGWMRRADGCGCSGSSCAAPVRSCQRKGGDTDLPGYAAASLGSRSTLVGSATAHPARRRPPQRTRLRRDLTRQSGDRHVGSGRRQRGAGTHPVSVAGGTEKGTDPLSAGSTPRTAILYRRSCHPDRATASAVTRWVRARVAISSRVPTGLGVSAYR